MAVALKRSDGALTINECPYGCCTLVYGKNVPRVRRSAKRRSKQKFRREARECM